MLIYHFAKLVSNAQMNMTNTEIRKLNLDLLIREVGKKSELAKLADTDPAYISQIISKGAKSRNVGDEFARKLEQACNKPRGWMDVRHNPDGTEWRRTVESNAEFVGGMEEWDSSTPVRDDEVELPFFREVKLAAGSGKSYVEENHGTKLRFLKSTLKGHVLSLNSAACVKVSGNSMEPVFPDGSTVGIDTANTAIKDGEIYAIDYNGHLLIKAIYRIPTGGIRLKSFNTEEWPDEPVTEEKMKLLRILGRVFWCSWLR